MSGTHDDLVVLAPAYVLGALEPEERRAFETHLVGCDVCASEVRSLGRVTAGLAQSVPQVTPRAALRDRVLLAVGAGDARATAVGAREARQTETRPRWAMGNWLAYAACVALATIAGLYAMNLRARVESLEARLEVAQLRLAAADRDMVDARRVAFEMTVGDSGDGGRRSHARRSAGSARGAAGRGARAVEPAERHGVRGDESAAASREADLSGVGRVTGGATGERGSRRTGRHRPRRRDLPYAD